MPPSGYLSAAGVEACLQYLASTYPAICQLITLPEGSIEGSTIHAIKLASGSGTDRHGVLFIGGVHARELVNPDLLVSFALKLCHAYTNGTGLTFGGKSYSASDVTLVLESMDVYILPLVNPDGREYVQSPSGDAMWRKNRNSNAGSTCKGVDINRNYDFLWSSGIGTDSWACSGVFKGASAFSEPETRNVRWMLDTYPNIGCMMDVHSYSELVLYPWGDDANQSTDPGMNFQNPTYNGQRGNEYDTTYKEYIPQHDWDWYENTGARVRDAIQAVRGRTYTVQQGVWLYPTSGTSKDYAYSRHFVDASKRRVHAYTLETADWFQPAYSEALNVIAEGSAGLFEFCLACFCVVEETTRGSAMTRNLTAMRAFRDQELLKSGAGRQYVRLLEDNTVELLQLAMGDPKLRRAALDVLHRVHDIVASRDETTPKVFEAGIIADVRALLKRAGNRASASLRRALVDVEKDLAAFQGRTVREGLRRLDARSRPRPARRSPKAKRRAAHP